MTFTAAGGSSNSMQSCTNQCSSAGFIYAGTEFSNECYCSNTLPTSSSSNCNMGCPGNPAEICGGVSALSVYAVSCSQGQQKCSSSGLPVNCVNGFWSIGSPCPSGQICSNGGCQTRANYVSLHCEKFDY